MKKELEKALLETQKDGFELCIKIIKDTSKQAYAQAHLKGLSKILDGLIDYLENAKNRIYEDKQDV